MTITRETLELAALAGGVSRDEGGMYVSATGLPINWRPHTDIGDAARLAVRLQMCVNIRAAWVTAIPPMSCDLPVSVEHDGTQADAERAYCEAVTLCAAEIGRKMKERE